ncbi:STAS domain-containing protein [Streptomyces sp. NPDC001941]|uniref:STAS domain-containing protein n=1 Tax=Streptomyces sp. NPDC001941 TaxID=3154659 RepID=UPI0033253150
MPDTLGLAVRHTGERTAVLTVTGDVDLHTAGTLRAYAQDVVQAGAPELVLDLAGVDFVDSTGLSSLIALLHTTQGAGGWLRLAEVPGRLMRMVTMTGLVQVMPVHTTVEDALAGRTPHVVTGDDIDGSTPSD